MHANCNEEVYFAGEFFIRKNFSQSESAKQAIEKSRTAENSTLSSLHNSSEIRKSSDEESKPRDLALLSNVSNSSGKDNSSAVSSDANSLNNSGKGNQSVSAYPKGSHTLVLDNNSGINYFFNWIFFCFCILFDCKSIIIIRYICASNRIRALCN